jgi:hypothetical protein
MWRGSSFWGGERPFLCRRGHYQQVGFSFKQCSQLPGIPTPSPLLVIIHLSRGPTRDRKMTDLWNEAFLSLMLIGKREKSSGYAKYPDDTKVTEWLGGTDEWIEKKKKTNKAERRKRHRNATSKVFPVVSPSTCELTSTRLTKKRYTKTYIPEQIKQTFQRHVFSLKII